MPLSQRLVNEMTRARRLQDDELLLVFAQALKELGYKYLYDSYTDEYSVSNAYTVFELARMKGGVAR